MIMDVMSFRNWYWYEASPEDLALYDRVEEFGDLFADMIFKYGTKPYELTKVQVKGDNDEWFDSGWSLPTELEDFSYSWFRYKIAELKDDICGTFNHKDSVLTVIPNADDSTILHEMIHLHESLLNDLPMYFHDMLYWVLYQDLKSKIPDLDKIIFEHAHILNETDLFELGGLHDILFLLKSFDLDIRMNYPLGTVFGYGRIDDFKAYSYTNLSSEKDN